MSRETKIILNRTKDNTSNELREIEFLVELNFVISYQRKLQKIETYSIIFAQRLV